MEKINWHDWFYYDETSPTFLRWKVDMQYGKWKQSTNRYAGDVAGTKSKKGAYDVGLFRINRKVHRVIYEMFHGEIAKGLVIDHIDGNSLNNEINNLRTVSQYVNSCNCKMSKNNSSGVTGMHLQDNRDGNIYYVARWTELSGKDKSKAFSINKLGIMVAFRDAVIHRQKMIEELNSQGAGYTERHGKESK
jgi:hypothetical protein